LRNGRTSCAGFAHRDLLTIENIRSVSGSPIAFVAPQTNQEGRVTKKKKVPAKKGGKLKLNKSAVRKLDDETLEKADGGLSAICRSLLCSELNCGVTERFCSFTIYTNHNQALRIR
jgi:hypothetical protein